MKKQNIRQSFTQINLVNQALPNNTPAKSYSAAFTLIELLVVVLIIGILALVALQQYRKTVLKARMREAVVLLDALHKAEEIYYLANGEYTVDPEKLDIEVKTKCSGTDMLKCGDSYWLDLLEGTKDTSDPSKAYLTLCYYVDEEAGTNLASCITKGEYRYLVYLDHSSRPNRRTCGGTSDLGKEFCKTVK